MDPALTALAIQEAPAIIELLRTAFMKAKPDATIPSDVQVIAAYRSAFISSLAVDDAWLAAHPVPVSVPL